MFAGELVRIDEPKFRNASSALSTLTFQVSRVYKGQAYAEQEIVTVLSSASCGWDAELGTWLIFAYSDTRWETGLCAGNRSGSAPASFGDGSAPLDGTSRRDFPAAQSGPVGWLVAGTLVAAAAVAVVIARRRRGRT